MLAAFDTENKPNGEFICGAVVDKQGEKVFRRSPDLRFFLKQHSGFVFANNLFYDFGNLYSESDFASDIFQINSGRTVIRAGRFVALKYKGYDTMFYDLFNYLRMSIHDIGEALNYPKLPFDPGNVDYCVRDAEIAFRASQKCIDFIGSNFGITPRPSTASYAMAIYKTGNFEPIPRMARDMEYFKRGYFGGRTEAFYIGTAPMAVYDINSAYPFAMTQDIPFGETHNIKSADIRPTDFVDCVVDVPDCRYGLLPVKYGWSSLCFPVGRISGRWWGIELLAATRYGAHIISVKNIVRYNRVGKFFKPYADYLYGLRIRYGNDPILKTFIKLILNSFYGKLASKLITQKIVTEQNDSEVYYDDYVFKGGSRFGLAERDYGFAKDSRVDVAGYITAVVRSLVLSAIIAVEPYYCDTDSLFVKPGVIPDNVGLALGAFKKEYAGDITIVGSKMYYSTDDKKIACKGIPKDSQSQALRHPRKQVVMDRPETWLTAMKTGTRPNVWKRYHKTIKVGADNRFGLSGWTEPFIYKGE